MKTYNDLYLDARRQHKAAGEENAQLEARELLCFASGKSREEFFRDLRLYATDEVEERMAGVLSRRIQGEPVAYIIGEWEFYGLTLEVNRDVLIPRMDTEVLAEQAILAARSVGEGARVLDLCAGSGCVGLAVAANAPGCRVTLGELSENALAVCKRNVRSCGLGTAVTCVRADALEAPPGLFRDFDVIACNPPYIPSGDIPGLDVSVKDYEPRMALDGGADGLEFYRAVIPLWRSALRQGGRLLLEVGEGQSSEVERLLAEYGYDEIRAFRDTAGIWRVVGGRVSA